MVVEGAKGAKSRTGHTLTTGSSQAPGNEGLVIATIEPLLPRAAFVEALRIQSAGGADGARVGVFVSHAAHNNTDNRTNVSIGVSTRLSLRLHGCRHDHGNSRIIPPHCGPAVSRDIQPQARVVELCKNMLAVLTWHQQNETSNVQRKLARST